MESKSRNSALSFWDLVYLFIGAFAGWNLYAHRYSSAYSLAFQIALLVFACIGLTSPRLARRFYKRAAKGIMEMQKALYSTPHEYRASSLDDFPDLDRDFYERNTRWAESQGFGLLGDLENVTLSRQFPKMRTCARTLISDDGSIILDICHVRLQRPDNISRLRDSKTLDFECEFANGTFVLTSNALELARTPPYPGIEWLRLPQDTPPDELLRCHRKRLSELRGATLSLQLTLCKNIQDVIAFRHRMQALKAAHKQQRGFIDERDLEMVTERPLTQPQREILAEVERLKNQDKP